MKELEQYEVMLREPGESGRWSLMFKAESFAHAEEQAVDFLKDDKSSKWEIIRIERDYA